MWVYNKTTHKWYEQLLYVTLFGLFYHNINGLLIAWMQQSSAIKSGDICAYPVKKEVVDYIAENDSWYFSHTPEKLHWHLTARSDFIVFQGKYQTF